MSTFKHYRAESRADWGVTVEDGKALTRDEIKLGCLLRIADATEAMAKNYVQLQSRLEWEQRYSAEKAAEAQTLRRQLAAARGQITKLRKRTAA